MSEPIAPSNGPRSSGRWLKAALIGSLALNALVIGVVLRGAWHLRATIALAPPNIENNLSAFIATLPAERRDSLRQDTAIARPGVVLRPLRVALRQARQEAVKAFLAEPFDRQAFVAAQAKVAEAENKLRTTLQGMLPDIASRMTPQERQAFVHWRRQGGFGGPRRPPPPSPPASKQPPSGP